MPSPLILLLLPVLAAVALVPPWRGAAAARLVIAAFSLATLHAATGSLLIGDLVSWAGQGPSQAMFVSLSSGIAIGGLGLWSRRGWTWWAPALPLALTLLIVFWPVLKVLPLLLGGVFGALPLLVGSLAPRWRTTPASVPPPLLDRHDMWLAVAALAAVASGRLAIMLLAPMMMLGLRRTGQHRRHLALPVLAALVLVALAAFAASLASPAVVFTSIGFPPPLAGSTERVLGAAILGAALLMVAPWPLHRWGPVGLLVPAAALMVFRVSSSTAPLGIAGWLPLAAMLLVPAAIIAAWRGHWATALGSVAVLAVARPGWQGLVVVMLVTVALPAVTPRSPQSPDRISFPEAWPQAVLLAAAMALATAAVLTHEVVLGALLAAGMAATLSRPLRPPTPT